MVVPRGCQHAHVTLLVRDKFVRVIVALANLTATALVMAAVASRIERLNLLARTKPDLPADTEFMEIELHALRGATTGYG